MLTLQSQEIQLLTTDRNLRANLSKQLKKILKGKTDYLLLPLTCHIPKPSQKQTRLRVHPAKGIIILGWEKRCKEGNLAEVGFGIHVQEVWALELGRPRFDSFHHHHLQPYDPKQVSDPQLTFLSLKYE